MRRRFMTGVKKRSYLTIEALENGLTASLSVNACEYCVNNDGNWKSLAAGTNTVSINSGQTLSFRGKLTPNSSNGIGTFSVSKKFNLKGNCTSMLFKDDANDNTSLTGYDYAFYRLFYNCSTLIGVSADFLPSTTLSNYCYYNMFNYCTALVNLSLELPATTVKAYSYGSMFYACFALTKAPELPATTLANNCYHYMFYNCVKLANVPSILPATTLKNNCYEKMFNNCQVMTTAPVLPATTLVSYCYNGMFNGCSNLRNITALFTTTPSTSYTSGWVSGVSASGTFYKSSSATWNVTGVNGIPSGWTIRTA